MRAAWGLGILMGSQLRLPPGWWVPCWWRPSPDAPWPACMANLFWGCITWRAISVRSSWGTPCLRAPTWCCWSAADTPSFCGSMARGCIPGLGAATTMRPVRPSTRWPGCSTWATQGAPPSSRPPRAGIRVDLSCLRAGFQDLRGATTPMTSALVASKQRCFARCVPWSSWREPTTCRWPTWPPVLSRWWWRCWWSAVAPVPSNRASKPLSWWAGWRPTSGCAGSWRNAVAAMASTGGWHRCPIAPITPP